VFISTFFSSTETCFAIFCLIIFNTFNVQGISISGFHKNILINKELNFHNYVNNKKERKGKMIEKDERRKN